MTQYAAVVDLLEALPELLYEARKRRGISILRASSEMDVAHAWLHRTECRTTQRQQLDCVIKALRWLDDQQQP